MRLVTLVVLVALFAVFAGSQAVVQGQGTIQPKDSDSVSYSGGSAGSGPAQPPAASGGRQQAKSSSGSSKGGRFDGFTDLESGCATLDSLQGMIQPVSTPGSAPVDAQIVQVAQDLNQKLEQIRETGDPSSNPKTSMNIVIRDQVDPTLLLKHAQGDSQDQQNPEQQDPDGLKATQKMLDGLKDQCKQARQKIEDLFREAEQKVRSAFGSCITIIPAGEPELCQAKQEPTVQSLQQWKQQCLMKVEKFEQINTNAINNPNPFKPGDGAESAGESFSEALQKMKQTKEQSDADTEDASDKVTSAENDMKKAGVGTK